MGAWFTYQIHGSPECKSHQTRYNGANEPLQQAVASAP